MCDNDAFDDMIQYSLSTGAMSRRKFGSLAAGAGLVSVVQSGCAVVSSDDKVAALTETEVQIKTPDGTCDAHFVHPAKGKHPAVLVWPDIFGLSPAFRQMGKRLAESGYSVLTVNPFYRASKAPTSEPGANFQDPATRQKLMALAGGLNATTHFTDAKAFVEWLDKQGAVDTKKKMGTTGYCMGGPITMRTAASMANRVGAGASFHGGGLVTANPDSPHLLVPKMKVSYLIAIAQNDDARAPTDKDKLREAFAAAKQPAEIEVYAAQHGWCPPGAAVYDHALAEKAWGRMLELFKKTLV